MREAEMGGGGAIMIITFPKGGTLSGNQNLFQTKLYDFKNLIVAQKTEMDYLIQTRWKNKYSLFHGKTILFVEAHTLYVYIASILRLSPVPSPLPHSPRVRLLNARARFIPVYFKGNQRQTSD